MDKVITNRKTNAPSGGLLGKWFSKPLRERFCKACGRPHVGHIEPIPTRRFMLGNVEIQMFESKRNGNFKHELKVQCWGRYRDNWYPQSYFGREDFEYLAIVVDQALRVMRDIDYDHS